MKKIVFLVAIAITMVSCKKEQNNFVSFSGKITNKNSDSIVISNPQLKFNRVIKVDENGVFKDTMNLKDGFYRLSDGKEGTTLYLKNGANVNMTLDTKEFDETVIFTGEGASESNFLAKAALLQKGFFKDKALFELPKVEFEKKTNNFINEFNKRIETTKLDSTFVSFQKKNIKGLKQYLNKTHTDKLYLAKNLAKGMASPKFVDYENIKGGTTSLDDLKGKYVYFDVWATWCNPCKKEIPFLQKMEEKYHGKNIEFVSISVDQMKDHEAWKKMIADKKLSGTQLFSDKNWKSKFVTDYVINGIPRFILIDPLGNIVNSNAPRPSDPKLIELFNSLEI